MGIVPVLRNMKLLWRRLHSSCVSLLDPLTRAEDSFGTGDAFDCVCTLEDMLGRIETVAAHGDDVL